MGKGGALGIGFVSAPLLCIQLPNVLIFVLAADQGTEVRASIVLSHGYADHTGRYHHVAKFFCDHGFQMIAIDHKYHGDDPNFVGWKIKEIKSFDEFRNDISEVLSIVELKYPDLPYFFLGHSMGGLIALMSTLELQNRWVIVDILFCYVLFGSLSHVLNDLSYIAGSVEVWSFLRLLYISLYPKRCQTPILMYL